MSDEKTVSLIEERARGCAEAARKSGGCQLVGAHATLDTKLIVRQMATSENAKTSKMSSQRLSDCCTVRVTVMVMVMLTNQSIPNQQ